VVRLASILDPTCIVLDVGNGSKKDVLERLAAPITKLRSDLDANAILDELLHRERESSTAIADGIAIPHARPDCRDVVTASFGRSTEGVDFDSLDGQPTRLLVVLVSPASNPPLHVTWLSHVARVLSDARTRESLLEARSAEEILDVLSRRENEIESAGGRSKVAG
jgi:mannitol/fructose-specific phosphotransferase system IIA component (Ntr-type)